MDPAQYEAYVDRIHTRPAGTMTNDMGEELARCTRAPIVERNEWGELHTVDYYKPSVSLLRLTEPVGELPVGSLVVLWSEDAYPDALTPAQAQEAERDPYGWLGRYVEHAVREEVECSNMGPEEAEAYLEAWGIED